MLSRDKLIKQLDDVDVLLLRTMRLVTVCKGLDIIDRLDKVIADLEFQKRDLVQCLQISDS